MSALELPVGQPVEPVLDWAAAENARLLNASRAALLRSGSAVTIEQISDATGGSPGTVRRRIHRLRDDGDLVAIKHGRHLLVPSFQLTDAFDDVDPAALAVVRRLRTYGLDDWAVWDWFMTPNTWLDGARPHRRLRERDVDALHRAVDGLTQA